MLPQVDGFRFDIMSCLTVSTMEKARDALRGLTLAADGIDGGGMLLYGEGWDFGEVRVLAGPRQS
jgi:pullulanase/glycogen debranching enzyme